jgi:hypothetical protein
MLAADLTFPSGVFKKKNFIAAFTVAGVQIDLSAKELEERISSSRWCTIPVSTNQSINLEMWPSKWQKFIKSLR